MSAFMAVYRGNPDGDDTYERRLLQDARSTEDVINSEFFSEENAFAATGQVSLAQLPLGAITALYRLAMSVTNMRIATSCILQ